MPSHSAVVPGGDVLKKQARQQGVPTPGPSSSSSQFPSDSCVQGTGSPCHRVKHACSYLGLKLSSSLSPCSHGGMASALTEPSEPPSNTPSPTALPEQQQRLQFASQRPNNWKPPDRQKLLTFPPPAGCKDIILIVSRKIIFEHLLCAGALCWDTGRVSAPLKIPLYGKRGECTWCMWQEAGGREQGLSLTPVVVAQKREAQVSCLEKEAVRSDLKK